MGSGGAVSGHNFFVMYVSHIFECISSHTNVRAKNHGIGLFWVLGEVLGEQFGDIISLLVP